MRALPLLEQRRKALETCVFCPKLCRSACPVSNEEPRETLTPWGKMSTASFAAHGDVPLTPAFARTAWACTGCMACREACDHENPVAGTLFDARSAFVTAEVAPKESESVRAGWDAHRARTKAAAHATSTTAGGRKLLVGCTYLRKLPQESRDAIEVARAIHGEVSLVDDCCGLPLLLSGDRDRFRHHVGALAERVGRGGMTVLDPGCAMALRKQAPEVGAPAIDVSLLIEEIAATPGRFGKMSAGLEGPVRYHDPCQLGRGLGVYEAPRQALTRALGEAPAEFARARAHGGCSGSGGLLPTTMPETARGIARERTREHDEAGGGTIVTACASSAIGMRKSGAKVMDLVTLVRRGLR
ncbi:(Fe-S)-binding protein [soil metagenome]